MGCTSAKNKFSAFGLHHPCTNDRDLAQLVAHTSGGREVAGSSPVIPTKVKSLRINRFSGFFLLFSILVLNRLAKQNNQIIICIIQKKLLSLRHEIIWLNNCDIIIMPTKEEVKTAYRNLIR